MFFRFSVIPSGHAPEVYLFHDRIAKHDAHIWPRTAQEIAAFAESGCVIGVWNDGVLVAMVYAALSRDERSYEVGGLTVDPKFRGYGLGEALVRFAVGHTLAFNDPWGSSQEILAHVHEANASPRKVLMAAGFRLIRQIELPGTEAPASLRRNQQGFVVGDEFRFERQALADLVRWLTGFGGALRNNATAEWDLGYHKLDDLRAALRELMTRDN